MMKVIHGIWSPDTSNDFFQSGNFYIWIETDVKKRGKVLASEHPKQVAKSNIANFFTEIGARNITDYGDGTIESCKITLPSFQNIPLSSPSINKYFDSNESIKWQDFTVTCLKIDQVLLFFKEIQFLSLYFPRNIKLGKDLEFWIKYSQIIKEIIRRDHYIPALRHKKQGDRVTIYPAWDVVSHNMREVIEQYIAAMPGICVASAGIRGDDGLLQAYDKKAILEQFIEVILDKVIKNTAFTQSLLKTVAGSFIEDNLQDQPINITSSTEVLKQWYEWQAGIKYADHVVPFYLCFKLNTASVSEPEDWSVEMMIESKKDPSFKILLSDYWVHKESDNKLEKYFGTKIEKNILILLGHATRVFPKLLSALDTDRPSAIQLSLSEAFGFLKEDATILQNSGYKVIVPSWWTQKQQNKIKIKLKAVSKKSSRSDTGSKIFSQDAILNFKYELAMDGNPVSLEEFESLVASKQSLVNFRGEWIEANSDHISRMIEFFNTHAGKDHEANYLDLLSQMSQEEDIFEYSFDQDLENNLNNLSNPDKFGIIDTPKTFNGELREYQKRGFSWLVYLEKMGLNPCLADDMGLGKTIQIISLLAYEAINNNDLNSLLIVPTSVLGNWQKEISKFAPTLKAVIHHGSRREKGKEGFLKIVKEYDVIITSFSLIRKDHAILKQCHWNRIIIDEAQNIKNPKASQTKSILALKSNSRIALTGTPIENRILDLWSIMNFLNPSYLGTEAEFRKNYELPIQKENDRMKSTVLKQLVKPFVLRREKTDKDIINDLPDKIEQKIFCNLTKEQASLYEATVKNVVASLKNSEIKQQQGIMLSTLLKLKQICNHPTQFLQDNSEFSVDRSHKLTRLLDMVDEVLENNESLLIFSQFKEVGEALEKLLKRKLLINPYFIHGGVSSKKREAMIEEFQSPDTEASVFILSLKAGGVGITLTKANHVFHFDRWWNPAVENQATDRAYRIGQKKKVMVHKFVTIGTLEEKIDEMIEKKTQLSSNILGTSESWLTNLDQDSFKDLIKLRKTAILE